MLALLLLAAGSPLQSTAAGSSTGTFQSTPKAAPIVLARRFSARERLAYSVKASYTEERRSGETITFVPQDVEQAYGFTLDVLRLKNDGFAEVRYRRPSATFTIGDTADRGPVAKTTKLNEVVRLTVSPINEVTDVVDETPRKPAKTPKRAASLRFARQADGATLALLSQFAGEITRLSFFLGSLDSSLDLAPRLPLEEVAPGDTWKRTVGYSPQKIKGEKSKQDVQRLDYTYTYVGIVESRGKRVHRVTAALSLKTDIADFGRQLAGDRGESLITKAPITLDASIEYDLDLATRHTLRAVATSRNSVRIFLKGIPNPIQESRAKGTTTLVLLSKTSATPGRAPASR